MRLAATWAVSFAMALAPLQVEVAAAATGGLCNLAKVRSGDKHKMALRSGPGITFKMRGRLRRGSTVYVCDSDAGWLRVVYGSPRRACGAVVRDGIPLDKTRSCKSGWIPEDVVEVLSG